MIIRPCGLLGDRRMRGDKVLVLTCRIRIPMVIRNHFAPSPKINMVYKTNILILKIERHPSHTYIIRIHGLTLNFPPGYSFERSKPKLRPELGCCTFVILKSKGALFLTMDEIKGNFR